MGAGSGGGMGGMLGGGGNPWGAAITSISAALQAHEGNDAFNDALDYQRRGLREGMDTRAKQYEKTQAYLDPYAKFGQGAIDKLGTYLGTDGKQFDPNSFQTDPGYQWRLEQGQKALERGAAAKGQLLGGAQQKALTNYAQGAASQEFQNAYNRLMGAAGMGMNAASQQAGYSNQFGNAQSQGMQDIGSAEAAAAMGKYRNWQALDSQAAGAWSSYFGGQGAGYASDKNLGQGDSNLTGNFGYGYQNNSSAYDQQPLQKSPYSNEYLDYMSPPVSQQGYQPNNTGFTGGGWTSPQNYIKWGE